MTRKAVRNLILGVAALLALGLVVDLLRPPERQWTARFLLFAIDGYQAYASPGLAAGGVRCRFEPTCSHYAEAVIRRDGAALGVWRTTLRLARCGPWTPEGTEDLP